MATIIATYKGKPLYVYGCEHLEVVPEQQQLARNLTYSTERCYWLINIYCSNKDYIWAGELKNDEFDELLCHKVYKTKNDNVKLIDDMGSKLFNSDYKKLMPLIKATLRIHFSKHHDVSKLILIDKPIRYSYE